MIIIFNRESPCLSEDVGDSLFQATEDDYPDLDSSAQ
jgi:hypothetical protein